MEFPFNIENLFGSNIFRIDDRLKPHNDSGDRQLFHKQICEVLDKMGIASAKAQGLHGPITGGRKLEFSNHRLYILTDIGDKVNEKEAVIGFIKVGKKTLFIYDMHGTQHEMEPLCVLDFYVHESRQRRGHGKDLFEAMCHEEGIRPHNLAVDRPSPKLLSFILKHYNLKTSIPQVNNFVVFEGFFNTSEHNVRSKKPPRHPFSIRDAHNQDKHHRQIKLQQQQTFSHSNRFRELRRPDTPDLLCWDIDDQKEALVNIRRAEHSENADMLTRPRSQQTGSLVGAQHMYSRHGNFSQSPQLRPDSRQGQRSRSEGRSGADTIPSLELPESREASAVGSAFYNGSRIRRDGPSNDYLSFVEKELRQPQHWDTSRRAGGRMVQPSAKMTQQHDTSWAVMGSPSRTFTDLTTAGRKYSRLW